MIRFSLKLEFIKLFSVKVDTKPKVPSDVPAPGNDFYYTKTDWDSFISHELYSSLPPIMSFTAKTCHAHSHCSEPSQYPSCSNGDM